jgi:hypothetical protein
MTEFVKNDRCEQTRCTDQAHLPVTTGGETFVTAWEITGGERPSNQQSDDYPTCIDLNFETEQLEQGDAIFEHVLSVNRSYPLVFQDNNYPMTVNGTILSQTPDIATL